MPICSESWVPNISTMPLLSIARDVIVLRLDKWCNLLRRVICVPDLRWAGCLASESAKLPIQVCRMWQSLTAASVFALTLRGPLGPGDSLGKGGSEHMLWLSKKSLCPKLDGQVVLGAALLRAVSLSMSLGRCPQELLEELLGWYTSLYAIVLHAGLRCLARYVNVYCPPGHDQVCFEAIANFWAS